MKILIIFTGGTIGSSTVGKYTSPDKQNNYVLTENYISKHGNDVEFDTLSPFSMLSETLSHKELNKIIENIEKNLDKDYDGIILTHGTDTLQYTAAALGFCFPQINIPVILVSSAFPLSHPEQNGNVNFEAAVAFIKAKIRNGVYISYKNKNSDETHIHFGTRAFSHLEITDSIYSISDAFYASYRDGKITVNPQFKFSESTGTNNKYEICPDSGILVVNSIPGDSFSYNYDGKNAILLRPYHSGTVNTASASFRTFCEGAKKKQIPVYIPRADIETSYASTELFDELSIKSLPCMTFVAAYMKLWIAAGIKADINEFMYTPINNEFINN